VYTWDETPYDPLIPRDVKKRYAIEKVLDKWPTFSMKDKERKGKQKFAREHKSLQKLLATLPKESEKEFHALWLEFEQGKSKEGRFVRQADKMESYLQGMEYWKKYGKIRYKLWARWAKEIFHDAVFIEFLREVDERFQNRRTQKRKRPVKPSSSKSVRKA
ncbi:MAG TPA: HD domain-containing protein, partial [Candidatus Wildermuthbacteria bacterium]|nr:HD domain-containing protein [Candidatus Wildermuthbacteria bacterium]